MFTFAFKIHKIQILFAILIFGVLIGASFYKSEWYDAINWFEAISGVGTLILATFLWWNSIRQAWESSLPKRLTAYYKYGGRDVIVFRNILLFSESDTRAWAQQIARQKIGGKDVEFEPFFRYKDKGVGLSQTGKPVKNYEIVFFLTAIPENLKSRLGYDKDESEKKWCIEWLQVEKDDFVTMEEVLLISNNKM
jgi:hypothetical protein